MVDTKLTDLTAASTLGTSDLFYVVQSSTSKKATGTQIQDAPWAFSGLGATTISANGASLTPAARLTGSIFTGGGTTNTKPQFLIEPVGATSANWNNAGALYGGNGPSGFTGYLLDLQLNGASRVSVDSTGRMTIAATMVVGPSNSYTWNNANAAILTSPNVVAGTLQLGAANAASPVAQTLQSQGSRSGTDTDVAGSNLTIASGQGTGAASASNIIFQTPSAVGSGTSAQTMATRATFTTSEFQLASTYRLSWNSDTFLTRSSAAVIQIGAANAASPVAQTLQSQGSRSGTDTNVAGSNLTITSGNGTGNSTGSSLIFQAPVAVASGTGAQTMTTVMTLTGTGGTYNLSNAFTFTGPFQGSNASGPRIAAGAASATAPTLIPTRADSTTGIGAQATGNMSFIVAAVEVGRIVAKGYTAIASSINLAVSTVAGLPAAPVKGATAFVSDASTTLVLGLGLTVVGGGANNVPVYYDGTNWIIG